MAKEFRAPVAQDFDIVEDGEVVGGLRVKPNGISWRPKNKHTWLQVTLAEFAEFAEDKAKKRKK